MATKATTRRRRRAPPASKEVETTSESSEGETKVDEASRLAGVIAQYRERGFETRSPVNCVRAFCIECMGGYIEEVKHCTRSLESAAPCPLYPMRMGKNTMSTRFGRSNPNAFKGEQPDGQALQTTSDRPRSLNGRRLRRRAR